MGFESEGKDARAIGDESVYFGVEEQAGDFAGEGGFFFARERGFKEALVKSFGALDGCGSAQRGVIRSSRFSGLNSISFSKLAEFVHPRITGQMRETCNAGFASSSVRGIRRSRRIVAAPDCIRFRLRLACARVMEGNSAFA